MNYRLTNEDIRKACGEIRSFLEDRKLDSKEQLRIVMGAEEVLLNYRKTDGSNSRPRAGDDGHRRRGVACQEPSCKTV